MLNCHIHTNTQTVWVKVENLVTLVAASNLVSSIQPVSGEHRGFASTFPLQ